MTLPERLEAFAVQPYRGRPEGCLKMERVMDMVRDAQHPPSEAELAHLRDCARCGDYHDTVSALAMRDAPTGSEK